jgi:transposase
MFIREYRTGNKKNGETYVKHRLVESVRTDNGPRQRIIMNLGQLTLPKSEWKKLAHALEHNLSNQETLLCTIDEDVERLALKLISNNQLSESIKEESKNIKEKDLITIDINSLTTTKSRTLGSELVCQHTWDLLGFDQMLKKCGFDETERTLSRAVIFGRLISPGSEKHTIKWFKKISALPEFPGDEIREIGKDKFYEIGDMLYEQKDKLEELLFFKERELFPFTEVTIFLYDLTNTYMEGSSLGNDLAEYGHCKSKRYDCPLITLSLLVSNDGMPIVSHIYKGNQSEPETMEDMIKRLEALSYGKTGQLPLIKPTIVMDRGIATDDNITYLKSNGYSYIIVRRGDESREYRKLFESGRETFTLAKSGQCSVYGDENNVYVKRIDPDDDNKICKVLCISDGKARKEKAIDAKSEKKLLDDIDELIKSIKKGSIKNTDKIRNRLNNKIINHKTTAKKYDIKLIIEDDKVTDIKAVKKPVKEEDEKLYGCYVIESTHTELEGIDLWKLYMTQSKVEDAFRAMKSDLGMRPVYHQNDKRSAAHLFITVLGYHLLATISNLLEKWQDTREWATIRYDLSTHMRNTIIMNDKDGKVVHVRVSGKPEEEHLDIYSKLGVRNPLKTVTYNVKIDCSDPTKS